MILNHLGAIASADTHRRFVKFAVENSTEILHKFDVNDLLAASIDNLDWQQSCSQVYCGDMQRSTHCTTIQICQQREALQEGQSRKRTSPIVFPPATKKQRRMRTLTEQVSEQYTNEMTLLDNDPTSGTYDVTAPTSKEPNLQDFVVSHSEKKELQAFDIIAFKYVQKHATITDETAVHTPGIQEFLKEDKSFRSHVQQPSIYRYVDILDMHADSEEAISLSLDVLHKKTKIGEKIKHLLVTGDATTYNHLTEVKKQQPNRFDWVIPFIGDFHLLYNYQKTLMKIYWDAGLKQIAAASGFRSETLTMLQNCSKYITTTEFLFQAWEPLLLDMYQKYQQEAQETQQASHSSIDVITSANQQQIRGDNAKEKAWKLFTAYVRNKGDVDENWKFWSRFVLEDGHCFITLYLAVRSSNWMLRLASIKEMVAIFVACDRQNYHRVIPQHLANLLSLPPNILQQLQQGKFSKAEKCMTLLSMKHMKC